MSEHVPAAMMSALADGELTSAELARVNAHLMACPRCTTNALEMSLLKAATARAGQRYAPPAELRERMMKLTEASRAEGTSVARGEFYRWAAVAALVLVCVSVFYVQRGMQRGAAATTAALVTEVCDQHIATLAANAPPEVISSDRHTVKPWFQGKIPFSFNLPQDLPSDVTLDGANLTYLKSQPTAQLLFSIGKHHVSVFVQQRTGAADFASGRAGFHVVGFETSDLSVVGVSDVDPVRLTDLMERVEAAQGH